MVTELELHEAAARNFNMLTLDMLEQLGVSWGRWNRLQSSGKWIQVTPTHFRHVATPLTFDMQVRAGSDWVGRHGALFGASALRWLEVDIPEPATAEFLVPRSRRSVANWVTIHTSTTWSPFQAIWHRGVRTTTAARAIVDFASTRPSATQLEDVIDRTIASRRTTLDRLAAEIATVRARGRWGIALLLELMLDGGGDSHLERRFLGLVRQNRIPRPQVQVVHREGSRFLARVDFMFGDVVVEVSGRLGHTTDRDRAEDAARRNALQQRGHVVLEFTTSMVIDDPTYVLRTLAASGVVPQIDRRSETSASTRP